MQNAKSINHSKDNPGQDNYDNWELSGEDGIKKGDSSALQNATEKTPVDKSKPQIIKKNSAAKAASQARSAVGNTNPNARTGLSDKLNETGTNVAYTERGE